MKKVIFLDVDGVLNSFQNQLANEKKGVWRSERICLDENALTILQHIVEITGAELVLSSTWRYPEYDGSYASKENLEKQLAEHGIRIADVTPLIDGYDRPGEILSYLNEHPEITRCVVLDDDTDINSYTDLRPFWVYIDPKYGLQERHIERVMKVFEYEELPENREFETMLRVVINKDSHQDEELDAAEKQILFNNIFNAETDNERRLRIRELMEATRKKQAGE